MLGLKSKGSYVLKLLAEMGRKLGLGLCTGQTGQFCLTPMENKFFSISFQRGLVTAHRRDELMPDKYILFIFIIKLLEFTA